MDRSGGARCVWGRDGNLESAGGASVARNMYDHLFPTLVICRRNGFEKLRRGDGVIQSGLILAADLPMATDVRRSECMTSDFDLASTPLYRRPCRELEHKDLW